MLLLPGMNEMVITHLDKLFVTSDAAVIVRELEVAQLLLHPQLRAPRLPRLEGGELAS